MSLFSERASSDTMVAARATRSRSKDAAIVIGPGSTVGNGAHFERFWVWAAPSQLLLMLMKIPSLHWTSGMPSVGMLVWYPPPTKEIFWPVVIAAASAAERSRAESPVSHCGRWEKLNSTLHGSRLKSTAAGPLASGSSSSGGTRVASIGVGGGARRV